MKFAILVLALASAAMASEKPLRVRRTHHRAEVAVSQPRFSVAQMMDAHQSGSMSMAELEQLAEMHGMSVIEGELYMFSKSEVLAARESLAGIVDDAKGWFSGLGSKIKGAFKDAWTSVKAKFTGSEEEFGDNIEKVAGDNGMSEDEKKGLAQAVDTAKDKNDPATKKTLYQALIDILTSAKTIEAISMFCRGVACLWEPEYRTCQLISPFKDMKAAIEAQKSTAKWSDIALQFIKRAGLRILIHGLSVAVRAAKVALDSLPGGSVIEGWVDSIYETCNIMVSGDAVSLNKDGIEDGTEVKEDSKPFLVGSACFVESIKKVADKIRTLILYIKDRKFKELVVELGKDETVNMVMTPSAIFSPGSLVKCMIDKQRKEVEATMTCQRKLADVKAEEWNVLKMAAPEKPTTEPVF